VSWTPFFFLLLVAGGWLLMWLIVAHVSGWPRLARRFRCRSDPDGPHFCWQVARCGNVNDNGATFMVVSADGLHLYANPLFRVGRPPLLIPWAAIRYLGERHFLWWRLYDLELGGDVVLRVRGKAFDAMECYLPLPDHRSWGPPPLI
jgi:hypothetical protein